MPASRLRRRSILQAIGGLAVGNAIAGCSDLSDRDETTTSTPTDEQISMDSQTPEQHTPTESEFEVDTPTPEPQPNLDHLHGITGSTYPPNTSGHHQRRFEWSAIGYDWWFELNIPRSLAEYYDGRYGLSDNYAQYVVDPYDNEIIKNIASEFRNFSERYNLTEWEVVNVAKSFVQGMQYTEDDVYAGVEQYAQYPVETLQERGGDCEDTSILLAAILRNMEYGCILLGLWETNPQHMALGVKGDNSIRGTYYEDEGDRYYYVETTGEGWGIGQMPEFEGSTQAEFIQIGTYPTVVYEYETEVHGAEVHVNMTIHNAGNASTSRLMQMNIEFQDEARFPQASASTQLDSILPDDTIHETLIVQPPDDTSLRLSTAVETPSGIHERDTSEWREPV